MQENQYHIASYLTVNTMDKITQIVVDLITGLNVSS
jgi:hypothetical protein